MYMMRMKSGVHDIAVANQSVLQHLEHPHEHTLDMRDIGDDAVSLPATSDTGGVICKVDLGRRRVQGWNGNGGAE